MRCGVFVTMSCEYTIDKFLVLFACCFELKYRLTLFLILLHFTLNWFASLTSVCNRFRICILLENAFVGGKEISSRKYCY